jgi:hypothetical protein
LSDQRAVDHHIQGITRRHIQLDHRTVGEAHKVANLHLGSPQLDGELHRHIHHQLDVVAGGS